MYHRPSKQYGQKEHVFEVFGKNGLFGKFWQEKDAIAYAKKIGSCEYFKVNIIVNSVGARIDFNDDRECIQLL